MMRLLLLIFLAVGFGAQSAEAKKTSRNAWDQDYIDRVVEVEGQKYRNIPEDREYTVVGGGSVKVESDSAYVLRRVGELQEDLEKTQDEIKELKERVQDLEDWKAERSNQSSRLPRVRSF